MKAPPERPDTVVLLVSTLSAGSATTAFALGAAAMTETATARPRSIDGILIVVSLSLALLLRLRGRDECRCAFIRACGGQTGHARRGRVLLQVGEGVGAAARGAAAPEAQTLSVCS